MTKSIHKLTIWNIGNGAACLKELTRKGQDFCPGDDIIRVNKGRFISVTDDDLAQFCLLMMKVMLWLKWIATQTETSPHSHQDIHQTSLTFKLSQNFIPLHFLLLLFLSCLPITPSSSLSVVHISQIVSKWVASNVANVANVSLPESFLVAE